MNLPTVLAMALAPVAFWLWYFYKKDRIEPEPKRLIVKTFFWGMVSVLPAIILEIPFRGPVLIMGAAPVIEEVAKFLAVYLIVYRDKEFDEPMDGIVYAAAAALGFASVENVLYLLRINAQTPAASGPEFFFSTLFTVFTVRALLTVPGHVIFSLMWGEALGIAKFARPERRAALIRNGLLLAIGVHAAFNFLVTAVPTVSLVMLGAAVFAWRVTHKKIEDALADSPHEPTPR